MNIDKYTMDFLLMKITAKEYEEAIEKNGGWVCSSAVL